MESWLSGLVRLVVWVAMLWRKDETGESEGAAKLVQKFLQIHFQIYNEPGGTEL